MKDIKKYGVGIATALIIMILGLSASSCQMDMIVYHAYQGPIFSLTAVSDTAGIVVERDVELDFSSYENTVPGESMVPFNESRKVHVEDGYVLTNTTAEDITLEVVYPFVGALSDKKEWVPEVWVNDALTDTKIALGRPVDECVEEYKMESEEAATALNAKLNVEMFEWIASDEDYMQTALTGAPNADDGVIVYKFKNLGYDGANEKVVGPNLKVSYVENENADVLPANWQSMRNDETDGVRVQIIEFDLPLPGEEGYGRDGYLVVLGEDISDVTMNCYASATGALLEDAQIEMERYESTLEEVAREIFAGGYEVDGADEQVATVLSEEEIFAGFLNGVCARRDIVQSQEMGYYADIDSVWYSLYESQQVMYAVFEVTVPAGEKIEVRAAYEKQAGHGVYEEDEDLDRYDILSKEYSAFEIISTEVTAIGSNKWTCVEKENGVEAFLHP